MTIGISGSIAAHKIPLIIDELSRYEIEIFVAMTKESCSFVSPLALEVLSKHPVLHEVMEKQKVGIVDHVFLAQESDLIVLLPATANLIGKLANGIADDIVSTICIASPNQVPKILAPAMNTEMYKQSIVQENLTKLSKRNYTEISPKTDVLASGKKGVGALADFDKLIAQILTGLKLDQSQ